MKPGPITQIITHTGIGEYRAAALDGAGRPCRLFRQHIGQRGAAVGDVSDALVRALSSAQGGMFVELDSGEAVFVSGRAFEGMAEGAHIRVEIVSGARRGKLARARITERPVQNIDRFAAWKSSLPVSVAIPEREDRSAVCAAFDDALQPSITLAGGGQIHIDQTRALVAIDVDASGRMGRGSAGARALGLNREAVQTAARHLALRNLGGAVVIDCVEPLNKAAGLQLRDAFAQAFHLYSPRKIDVLAPSKFGLIEAAIEWGDSPLADQICDDNGSFAPVERLQLLLRELEREAAANGAALYSLDLSGPEHATYLSERAEYDKALADRFGGRIIVNRSEDKKSEVRRR